MEIFPPAAARGALDGGGARASSARRDGRRPARRAAARPGSPASSSSTSRPTCPTTCSSRPTSPRWRTRSSCARRSSTTSSPSSRSACRTRSSARARRARSRCAARSPPTCRREILARGKAGFGVPVARWFREDLRELAGDVLLDERARGARPVPARGASSACSPSTRAARADHGEASGACSCSSSGSGATSTTRDAAPARRARAAGEPRSAIVARRRRVVLPRLARGRPRARRLLARFTEKSDRFARTFVASGTFGFIPGVPSAYTQPLYAFFLAPLYWIVGPRLARRSGSSQIALAAATALARLRDRRARRPRARVGVVAALLSTLHPYLVWHDVHINREILDGSLAAALVLAVARRAERRDRAVAAVALGVVAGLAILGNAGSSLLPLVLAAYLVAWDSGARARGARRPSRPRRGAAVVAARGSCATRSPSAAPRSRPTPARSGRRTTSRPTRSSRTGDWIDQVPELPGAPPWPEVAADLTARRASRSHVDECAQMRFYQRQVRRLLARPSGREGEARRPRRVGCSGIRARSRTTSDARTRAALRSTRCVR